MTAKYNIENHFKYIHIGIRYDSIVPDKNGRINLRCDRGNIKNKFLQDIIYKFKTLFNK